MARMNKLLNSSIFLLVLTVLGTWFIWNRTLTDRRYEIPARAKDLRVAMLLSGSIEDQAFNTKGHRGLMLIRDVLGVRVAFSEKVSESGMQPVFQKYAGQGYDIIIGWGGQFLDAARRTAIEYPGSRFLVMGIDSGNGRNLGAVSYRHGEIGYLARAVAGLKTRTGKIAFVTGTLLPHQKVKALFFKQGARSINPEVEFRIVELGTWQDPEQGKTAGLNLVKLGFDVIAVDADEAGLPIHALAGRAGRYTIGWRVDQNYLSPRSVLTSGLQRAELAILAGARAALARHWKGRLYQFGIRDGVLDLAPFRDTLSPGEKKRIGNLRQDLVSGRVQVLP